MTFDEARHIARHRAIRTGHTVYVAFWGEGNDYHWTERQDAPESHLLLAYIPDGPDDVVVSNKPYDPR